jgi:Tfp pilus assembly PilM family ATPase
MSLIASWLAAPPADAAIEIAPEAVSAAAVTIRGTDVVVQGYATEPLPAGALAASLTAQNLIDRRAVAAAVLAVTERLGTRPRRVALLVPDVTARVSLVRFDKVPARSEDLEQLVRWQVRKSAPFPVEESVLTFAPGARTAEGAEFIAVLARRAIIRDYETLCEELGIYAGLVDLTTFGVVNLLLAGASLPAGDWLVVHVRPEYTSLAIMRGDNMIFFRNVPGGEPETLADAVHQTTMYHQDRLSGRGFSQVLLGGVGRTAGALDTARRNLETRLGVAVRPIDVSRLVGTGGSGGATVDRLAMLAPLVGTLLRMRVRVAA